MTTLVAYLADNLRTEPQGANNSCDADYSMGYVMYLIADKLVELEDGTMQTQKNSQHLILDI